MAGTERSGRRGEAANRQPDGTLGPRAPRLVGITPQQAEQLLRKIARATLSTAVGRAALESAAREAMIRGVIEPRIYGELAKGLHAARQEARAEEAARTPRLLERVLAERDAARLEGPGACPSDLPASCTAAELLPPAAHDGCVTASVDATHAR